MPEWAAAAIVTVVTLTGGGVLGYLIKIERSLGEIVATQAAARGDIEDLKTWRLNQEQARALALPPRYGRRGQRDIP